MAYTFLIAINYRVNLVWVIYIFDKEYQRLKGII